MKKFKIIKWYETLMLDSFGDVTEDEFEQILDVYKDIIKAENPACDIDIEVEQSVGYQSDPSYIEFSDGDSTTDISPWSEKYFRRAIESI